MSEPELHKGLQRLAFLLGTWRGEGAGRYPTIDEFVYGEELRFWHDGRPILFYSQRTWSLETEMPMHSEMGFWRPQRDGTIEAVLAHTFGIVEIQEGSVEGKRIALRSKRLASTPSAKEVAELSRTYDVQGDLLACELQMAFGEEPLQNHLSSTLRRV